MNTIRRMKRTLPYLWKLTLLCALLLLSGNLLVYLVNSSGCKEKLICECVRAETSITRRKSNLHNFISKTDMENIHSVKATVSSRNNTTNKALQYDRFFNQTTKSKSSTTLASATVENLHNKNCGENVSSPMTGGRTTPLFLIEDNNALVNETEEEFMTRMELRMKSRRKWIKKACTKLGLNKSNETYDAWSREIPSPKPWLFTSMEHRLLFCEIPKAGCTNWKKVMMVLNGLANDTDSITSGKAHSVNLGTINYLPNDDEKDIYREFVKLIVVRDPMERLASAYVDKVAEKKTRSVFSKFSSEIAKKYGDRWTNPTKYLGDGLREITACDIREAELSCENPYEVIKVEAVIYGRKDNISCGVDIHWHDGQECISQESIFIVSQLCDGKRKCTPVASTYQFGEVNNCSKVSKYLQVAYRCISTENMNVVTVCYPDDNTIKCPRGGVISIGSAFFGRKNKQTCSYKSSTWNTDCSAEIATAAVISACHHRQTCTVSATAAWIKSDPCPATTKYLKVWYICVEKEPSQIISPPLYKLPAYIPRKYDHFATFEEFVSYLIDPANSVVTDDVIDHGSATMKLTSVRHWQNYHTLCYPCHIEYDVIAHMETIADDARYLLKLINASSDLKYPVGYDKEGKSSTKADIVRRLFSKLTRNEIAEVFHLYREDYELFGYRIPVLASDL